MKLTTHKSLLILWFIFAGVFYILGTIHLEKAGDKIEIPEYELPKGGIAAIEGVKTGVPDIKRYAKDLKKALAVYIENYNHSTREQNRFAAYGYFLAFGTSVASFIATLFGQRIGKENRKT